MDELIETLQSQIKNLEAEMAEIVRKESDLAQKYWPLISIRSIGRIVAISLICYLPEFGSLSVKQIAKFAGLSPTNWDSGQKQGKRSIQGGRVQVRKALYMSIISAKEFNNLNSRLDGSFCFSVCWFWSSN